MGTTGLVAALVAAAAIGTMAYCLNAAHKKIRKLIEELAAANGTVDYYKKETARLRDGLSAAVGQNQVAHAELLRCQDEIKQLKRRRPTLKNKKSNAKETQKKNQ